MNKEQKEQGIAEGLNLLDLGVEYIEKGIFSTELTHFEHAENYFGSAEYLNYLTFLNHERAVAYMGLKSYEDCPKYFDLAEQGYIRMTDYKGLALLLIHRSDYFFKIDQEKDGFTALRQAEYLIDKKKIDSLKNFLINSFAESFYYCGAYYESIQYYKRLLVFEDPDSIELGWAEYKIGIAFEKIFAFDEVEHHYRNAYNIFLRHKDYQTGTEVMAGLVDIFNRLGKKSAAKDLSAKMINLNQHFISA